MPAVDWNHALEAVRRRQLAGQALTGVTEDTRRLRPGMVFVARRGLHTDGHDLLEAARGLGAVLTVGSRRMPAGGPDVLVADPAEALALLVSAWHGDPGFRLRLIGITGTNGKTTAAHLTTAILQAAGCAVGTVGTLGYSFGGSTVPPGHTTPPPEVLYPLLAEWAALGATHAVMEVSAQALTQRRTAACPFAAAALTSFARDHGEFYPDQEAYRAAKLELFHHLRGAAVLPASGDVGEGDLSLFVEAAAGAPATVFFGGGPEAGAAVWAARRGPLGLDHTPLTLHLPGEAPQALRLPLPGEHNVQNAACAAAIAWSLGIPAPAIVAGLQQSAPPAGRALCLQLPERGAWAVVDYAHNPAALAAVLRWLRQAVPGRIHLVLGARGGRDRGKRPLMGAVVAALADGAVFTSDRPAEEDPEEGALPLLRAAQDCGLTAAFVRDRAEAIGLAVSRLGRGDCVVVCGKGTEPWQGDSPGRDGMDDPAVLEALGAVPLTPAAAGSAVGR